MASFALPGRELNMRDGCRGGLRKKDPHILRPFGHGEWGPLKTFLRILPQMPSLGRIRTGKRYGALPLGRNPNPELMRRLGTLKKKLKNTRFEVAMCMPISIGKCSPNGYTELIPLTDYFIRPDSYKTQQLITLSRTS